LLASRNDRPNFNRIIVGKGLISGDEFAVSNHQNCFPVEVETRQQIDDRDGTFDIEISARVMESNFHPHMIAGGEPKHLGAIRAPLCLGPNAMFGLLCFAPLPPRWRGWLMGEDHRLA